MLVANANVDVEQRVSILAAARSENLVDQEMSNVYIIMDIKYENVVSVLRQHSNNSTSGSSTQFKLHANAARVNGSLQGNWSGNRKKQGSRQPEMSVEEFQAYKSKQKCKYCGIYEHFGSDNNDDGSLKSGVSSRPAPMSQNCQPLNEGSESIVRIRTPPHLVTFQNETTSYRSGRLICTQRLHSL